MDKQSSQPMLEGVQPLQIESGNVARVPSTHSFFKKNRSRGLVYSLIGAIVLCVILFIALCISLFSGDDLCLTPQCLRSASSLLQSIDFDVEPCDNFYDFVCGKWKQEHFVRNGKLKNSWFEERQEVLEKTITDFFQEEDDETEPTSVIKARTMYRACLDTDAMDEDGLNVLGKALKEVGLPPKPLIYRRSSWDWIGNVAKARRKLNMDILIGFVLGHSPENRTIYKLAVDIPKDLESTNLKSKHKDKFIVKKVEEDISEETIEKVNNWKKETADFLKYFFLVDNDSKEIPKSKLDLITKAAGDIITIRSQLAELEKEDDVVKANAVMIPEEMTVYELQELVNNATKPSKSKIRWLSYFDTLYSNTSVSDVKSGLENNETILVYNKPYYVRLSEILSEYSDRQIGLFIWWRIVYTLAMHVNTDLADLRKQVDLVPGYEHGSREDVCVNTVSTAMRPAISRLVMRQPNLEEKQEKVKEMIGNIKEAFVSLVEKLSWMDETTKERTLEKVTEMESVVLYPYWMTDDDNFNQFYENIEIKEDTHLENLLKVFEADGTVIDDLRELDLTIGVGLDPLDINAFYTPTENLVFVPAMILQFPFYDMGLEALNYGSIGVIIGHEVTHGFDDTGRSYNKLGNYHEWWTEDSNREYNERAQCYIDKFNNYYIESVNKTVDGNRTLDENLADNGGLIEGFLAYKKYVERHGEEPKLPGLEQYTHEQLFFISYAHSWCAAYDGADGILEALDDEHSPEFVRILVTLQDSDEFSKVWSCPKGSNMNPSKGKCSLWVDQ